MEKIKLILPKLTEYYLIVLVLLSGYTPPFLFNPLSIGIAAVLILQIIFKNKITGLLIAGLFAVINLYMTFALISELSVTSFSIKARNLLLGGLSLIILNFVVAGIMIYKYSYLMKEKSHGFC